jgi:hypothetical protein
MTSPNKITANRKNAGRSTGPRTDRGKSRASRNALKHGLTMFTLGNPTFSSDIECIAKAICGDDARPRRYEQALIIAECDMVMRHVRAARTVVWERLIKPRASRKHQLPGFPSDDEWEGATDAVARGRPQRATKLFYRTGDAASALAERVAANIDAGKEPDLGGAQEPDPLSQHHNQLAEKALDVLSALEPQHQPEALHDAISELRRLDRYESRALSRRRRAIRGFTAASLLCSRPRQFTAGKENLHIRARDTTHKSGIQSICVLSQERTQMERKN